MEVTFWGGPLPVVLKSHLLVKAVPFPNECIALGKRAYSNTKGEFGSCKYIGRTSLW